MINWSIQKELRQQFLSLPIEHSVDYWKNEEYLKQYDLTFAQRIRWKWQAVLEEITLLGFEFPTNSTVLDWGCGTGAALEAVLPHIPRESLKSALVFDRTRMAQKYAIEKIGSLYPTVQVWDKSQSYSVLLLSHVLNELSNPDDLQNLMDRAECVIWLEPGTSFISKKMIQMREHFRNKFTIVAPCPHQNLCGLIANPSRHWCHFYVPPSPSAFHTAFWREWSEKMGIDLRSITVSYLVLSKTKPVKISKPKILGRVKVKGNQVDFALCESGNIREVSVAKKNARVLVKEARRNRFPLILPSVKN